MNLVPILVIGLLLHSDCRGWYNSLCRLWNNYNYLQLSFWDSRQGASTVLTKHTVVPVVPYLPDNRERKEVLALLRRAFNA